MHKLYVVKYSNGLYEAKRDFTEDLHTAKLFDSIEWAKDRAETKLRAPLAFSEIVGQTYEIIEVKLTELAPVNRT